MLVQHKDEEKVMKSLILSKWTQKGARFIRKHFLVRQQDEKTGFVVLQSVIDKSTVRVSVRDLLKSRTWSKGWQ